MVLVVSTIISILSICSCKSENYQYNNSMSKDNIYDSLNSEECSLYKKLSALPQEIQNIICNNGTFFDVENQKNIQRTHIKQMRIKS